jgi:4-amino-4-deoxy-L-arabinose transferase-like glycosyltransferase
MQQPQSETIAHSHSAPRKLSSDFLNISILLLAGAIILFINIGGWDLWNPDEPRYAQVAREMMQTGNYLVPHINSEIYPDKPPLFFWLIALASKPFGDVTAASARIPSAVACLGVILLTYLFGRILYNQPVGFLAGLILLSNTQFIWIALRANLDMTLTLWTTLSLFLFYSGYTREKSKTAWYLLSYGAMGLAVLTKGPVGFAIPLLTIALFLIVQMQFKQFKELSIGKGVLIIAGVTAVWLVPACILGGGEYAREIIFKQTIGRTVDSFSHKQPFYNYLLVFPADFNPWTIFIPSAVIYFWTRRKSWKALNLQFPLMWFLGTFVFFSLISGKRNLYLMPLYPAAALLMACFWYDFILKPSEEVQAAHPRLLTIPFYLLFGSFTIFSFVVSAAVLFGVSTPQLQEFDLDIKTVPLYPLLTVLCAGGLAGLLLIRKRVRTVLPFSVIILVMCISFIFSVRDIYPSINTAKSAKPFCDRINKIVRPEDKLVAFRFDPESFNYFLNRTPIPVINDYEKMKGLLKAPEKVYVLILARHLDQAPEDEKKIITVLDESQIGHRKYYFFVNHAAGSQ